MKLLLDEMISPAVAVRLREIGVDAVSVQERGTRSSGDPAQMEDAVSMARAIVTYNIDDFVELVSTYAETGRHHFGVVFVSEYTIRQRDIGGLIRALFSLCRDHPAEDALANQCTFLRSADET